MLRADKNARIVKLPFSIPRVFTGRYALASGRRTFDARWTKPARDAIMARQEEDPVSLLRNGARVYWLFQDCFYWEDEGLMADDVKALALQRTRRRERQLATAPRDENQLGLELRERDVAAPMAETSRARRGSLKSKHSDS